jgi:hypothetical protein
MSYFRERMRLLRGEYTAKDRDTVISAAGGRCSLCGRKSGDEAIFGPTNYLKKRLRFWVYIDIHVIEGGESNRKNVIMCNFCHITYHLWNRLSESADFGGKSADQTVYQRCRKCQELSCRCCKKCKKAPKWCTCKKKKKGKMLRM